jgi:predicted outer membrane protein
MTNRDAPRIAIRLYRATRAQHWRFVMTTRPLHHAALAAVIAMSGSFALAANDKETNSGAHDQDFVNTAWTINTAEVRLGKLAQSNSSNADVQEFGKQMVKEHEELNTSLKEAADKEGETLPSDLDQKHTDLYDKLSKLSGSDFDKEYMTAMIKGHHKAIDAFTAEIRDRSQTSVEQWAEGSLPHLRMHSEMAQKTGKQVGAEVPDEAAAAQTPDQPAAGK